MAKEIKLLQASMDGDTAAFEQIVNKYQSLVCAITFSGTGRVDVSEELAQETFLSAWKNLRQLKKLSGFKAWLCAIARNMLNNYYRRKKPISLESADIAEIADRSQGPSETLITQEEHIMLEQALMRIPAEYREPLVMYYRQQQSTRQVAASLGLNESTVRTRLHRAKQMLREEVAVRLERTLERTAPGKTFTKAVMVAVGGVAVGAAATANAAGSGVATVLSTLTAKIITAVVIAAVVIGGAVIYKQLTQPEQPVIQSNAIAVVMVEQDTAVATERTETTLPDVEEVVVNPIETPEVQVETMPNNSKTIDISETESVTVAIQEEPVVEIDETFICKGSVADFEGLAVSNAKVILYHDLGQRGLGNHIVEETMSDGDGMFAFTTALLFAPKPSTSNVKDVYIALAIHPDHAFGWQYIRQGQEQQNCELILTAPTSHTITVTDHQDNPLAGVHVWPYTLGDSTPLFRDHLTLSTEIDLLGSVTDDNGEVTITNLPKTQCVFNTTLEGYALGFALPGGKRVHLSPGANIQGQVIAENNKPVEGAIVKFNPEWIHHSCLAKTDAKGHFFFKDLPGEGWDMSPFGESENGNGLYDITVNHEKHSIPGEQIQLLPGDDITDFIINAYSDGVLVKCNVIAVESNKPVAGVRVGGFSESGRIDGYSDENGIFSFRVEPGPANLRYISPPEGMYVLAVRNMTELTLRFEAVGEEMDVTLRVPEIKGPLVKVSGYVLDGNGIGQSDAEVYAEADKRIDGSYVSERTAVTDYDGWFELKVPAGLNMHFYVETKNRSLAGTGIFEIPADPNEIPNVEVNLKSTESCEQVIRDEDGNPVCNTTLEIRPVVGPLNLSWSYNRIVKTDGAGFLRVDGIVPGLEYYLYDNSGPKYFVNDGTTESPKPFKKRMVLLPLEADIAF